MRIQMNKPRIGILALMQGLYDKSQPEIPAEQSAFVQKVMCRLDEAAEFVFPGLAKEREQVERYVKQFQYEELDGIMILNVMYSPGLKLIQAFKKNTLPVLLANIQPIARVEDYWDWHYLTTNQGIHGIQDTANMLLRLGYDPAIITEDWQSEAFCSYVKDWALAAAAVHGLAKTRTACFEKMKNMGDILGDEFAFFKVFGMELLHEGIGSVQACLERVTEQEIDAQIAEDRKNFNIDEKLSEEAHRYAARLQLAFEKYCEEKNYDGFTANFDVFGEDGRFRQLPLLAASNMMAKGYAYAAEGDVHTIVLMALGQLLTGCAQFTEMYSLDFERDACMFAHMGEGNWKTARKDRPVRLIDRPLDIGGLDNPPTPVFSVEPGTATVASLAALSGDRYRIVAMKGTVLDEKEIGGIPMNHTFFRPDSGVKKAMDSWLQAGGTHHEVLLCGDRMRQLEMVCRILGIEFREV